MKKYPSNVCVEDVKCPNGCEVTDQIVLIGRDRIHDILGEFQIVRCLKCELERTNPRPTAGTIGAYYPDDYAPYQSSFDVNSSKKHLGLKLWLRSILRLDARQLPAVLPGRMLEVGCASGVYMEQMRSLGWEVEGIEFAESAASVARTKGFKVQSSSLEDAASPQEPYDIITAWMVLEHLHQPVECLKMMRDWVKKNGYLVAAVPDAESLAKTLFKERCYDLHLPNHLFHYTPKTLGIVLNNAGWKLERVIWQKNCNTLLWSAEYWARETHHRTLLKIVRWVRISNQASRIRLLLGWLLGVTHQSGRIEIWARPMNDKDGN